MQSAHTDNDHKDGSIKEYAADVSAIERTDHVPASTPLPFPQFPLLMLISSIEPLVATAIMPIAVEATKLSGVAQNEKALGYYAGAIEGSFYLAEALCVLQWGRLSDRIGRKPVLIVGLLGMALSTTLFGFSRSFAALVLSRMVCGFLNGNIGVIKSCAGESLDETNEARGFSIFSASFAISVVVGPILGSALAHPDRHFGGVFDRAFWREHPFALGCFVIASLGVCAALLTLFRLQETLPSKVGPKYRPLPDMEDEKAPEPMSPGLGEVPPPIPSLRQLIGMRHVRCSIAAYLHLAGVDIGWAAALVLWGSTSIENGGLSLTERQIGLFLACSGGLAGVSQALLFAKASARWGPKRLYRAAMACWTVPFALMPVANLAARHGQHRLTAAVMLVMIPFLCCAESGYPSTFLFVQNSAPKEALGSVNGMSQTCISLIRATGPILASSLFAFSVSHNLLGGTLMQIVFIAWALFASIFVGAWLPTNYLRRERRASEMTEL